MISEMFDLGNDIRNINDCWGTLTMISDMFDLGNDMRNISDCRGTDLCNDIRDVPQ